MFVEQARKLIEAGATEQEVADEFGVHVQTLIRWGKTRKEFREALKMPKETADQRVERSLFHRAVGYSFDAEKIVVEKGRVTRVPYREHIPPDTTACIFWLKNRRPDLWRDKVDVGGKVEVDHRHAHLHASLDQLRKSGVDLDRYSFEQLEAIKDYATLTSAPTKHQPGDVPSGS